MELNVTGIKQLGLLGLYPEFRKRHFLASPNTVPTNPTYPFQALTMKGPPGGHQLG